MRGFKLDERGDIVIENGSIALVSDNDLKAQTLKTVLGTNKGEWFMNRNEGIIFDYMLGKGVNDEMRLAQVKDACAQVDSNLSVSKFDVEQERKTRKATVTFTATGENGESVTVSEEYGDESNTDVASKLATANAVLAEYRSATDKLARRLDGETV